MLLATFICCVCLKLYGYSDIVIAFSYVRTRESNGCPPTSPPPREIHNAACRHIHRRAKSVGDNITHPLALAPSRSPFNSHRNAASPKPVAVLNLRYRHRKSGMTRVVMITHERANSFGGIFTHSHVRRRRHDRRSTHIETRHRQSSTMATGRIWRNETASLKYPSIRCYRSSSRYQVTPHRTSCPCLVSFSVGHYDVLVSTPDSMFSVV